MAKATLPDRKQEPVWKYRLRFQSEQVAVELIPHRDRDSWYVAIFRDRHIKATSTPLPSAKLPALLSAAGTGPMRGTGWEATPWPVAESNPYREHEYLGVVYYIEAATLGLIKIGTTTNIKNRLADLQMTSPANLRVLYTCTGNRTLEATLHRRFWQHRSHGEWFHPAPEVLAFMEQEVTDALQLYRLHCLPWGPTESPRRMSASELLDREAERIEDLPGFLSGSFMKPRRRSP